MEARVALKEIAMTFPYIIKSGEPHIWYDYDEKADVLYVNFQKPSVATDSEMLENNIVLRYKGKKLIGMTVLNAKSKTKMAKFK